MEDGPVKKPPENLFHHKVHEERPKIEPIFKCFLWILFFCCSWCTWWWKGLCFSFLLGS